MNRLTRLGAAACIALVSIVAYSQMPQQNPDDVAIKTRQGLFKLISNQFGGVAGLLRGGSVDPEVAARNAERIKVLAGMIPELFARDTRQFKDTPTKALDGIWNSQADFKTKADGLASAADELATAGKSGDKAAMTKAAQDVGKACGACHDSFRAK
ncbi:MAG TPA: cytochrome c [Steroidobacteraceae bacterium]|nr:cytochrome c [Steroidobacteraceae bacterium]